MTRSTLWPKLSVELPGPKAPDRCQSCGTGEALSLWREHDANDGPTHVVVVLCRRCADRIVEPHPRLYSELPPNQPHPGAMPLCLDCRHRDGVRCTHPDARANGGPGVLLTVARPTQTHVCRSPRRLSGWITHWPEPARECRQREAVAPAAQGQLFDAGEAGRGPGGDPCAG